MKRSKYIEFQVIFALQQAEMGTPVADLSLDKHMLQEVLKKSSVSTKFRTAFRSAVHRLDRIDASGPHQGWSMVFEADHLFEGRRFRALTIVDNFSRKMCGYSCGLLEQGRGQKGEIYPIFC